MQQIGQYTDNGNVVRVFPPAQAMGLNDDINDMMKFYMTMKMPFGWRDSMKKKKGGGKKC